MIDDKRQFRTRSGLAIFDRSPLPPGTAETPLAVLVHGSMDRAASFRRLAKVLRDYRVITYDRRGYEGSASVSTSARFADQVKDLAEVVDTLNARGGVAFGHSFGANVVLSAAQQDSGLFRAVLAFEPPLPWMPGWAGPSGSALLGEDHSPRCLPAGDMPGAASPADAAEIFMRRMVGDQLWARLPAATQRQRRAEGVALEADLRSLGSAPPPFDPALISLPVIVGVGGSSFDYHQQASRRLAELLPDAELVSIAGSTHGAHLSHPADLGDLVRRAWKSRR